MENDKKDEAPGGDGVKYRQLFEGIGDSIIIYDTEGRVLSVNEAACREYGYSKSEFLSMTVAMLDTPEEAKNIPERINALMTRGSIKFETRHRRKDNSQIDLEVGARLIEWEGRPAMMSICRDISWRKDAEALLEKEKNRFRELFENMRSAVAVYAAVNNGANFRFVSVNRRAEAIDGVKRDELIGSLLTEVFPGAGEFGLLDVLRRVWTTGKAETFPAKFYKDERISGWRENFVYKLPSGEVVALYDDVTERENVAADTKENHEIQTLLNRMLQQSLSNSSLHSKLEGHLAGLLNAPWMPVEPKGAVFLMDSAGRNLVLTVNMGLAPELLAACARVPLGKCVCGRAAASGRMVSTTHLGPEHETTYEGMKPHGHCCVPIRAGGKTFGVICLYLNENAGFTEKQEGFIGAVTGIIAADIVHYQTQEQLIHSQKMESVGRLAGGVAHDFNNLVTAINGYAQILLNSLPPEDARRGDAQEILAAGDRAAGLTRQLLAFGRKQVLKPAVLDLNSAVRGVSKMIGRLIGENIRLEVETAPGPCLARLDAGQFDQVLVNLAVNARDAMPAGGVLSIRTEAVEMPPAWRAEKTNLRPGPLLRVTVSDTGTGMSQEVKDKLFEPFFSTKETGKGTGLGLSTVYGIVMQSGGEIEVESAPGQGSLFSIYFPMLTEGEAARPAAGAARPAGGRETVLFVEDEEALLKLGSRVLRGGGYTLLTAPNGADALRILGDPLVKVDLVITDMLMPGVYGVELARQAVAKRPDLRILYTSGYTQDAVAMDYVGVSSRAFIQKPFSPDSLLLKVRLVLDSPPEQARP